MKKNLVKTTGVILLVAPFMAVTADTSLDDAYSYESSGAFDSPMAHSRDVQRNDVSSDEMYAWEQRDSYDFRTLELTSSERTEIAVFEEMDMKHKSPLHSYTGEYGGDGE